MLFYIGEMGQMLSKHIMGTGPLLCDPELDLLVPIHAKYQQHSFPGMLIHSHNP
jgi:hypothetical protein